MHFYPQEYGSYPFHDYKLVFVEDVWCETSSSASLAICRYVFIQGLGKRMAMNIDDYVCIAHGYYILVISLIKHTKRDAFLVLHWHGNGLASTLYKSHGPTLGSFMVLPTSWVLSLSNDIWEIANSGYA